jgi:predicted lysophospholipase L1 biosynthesis ABC-type transport system permease subunit
LGYSGIACYETFIAERALIAAMGGLAGAAFGFLLVRLAARYFLEETIPGFFPAAASAFVLMTVAVVASMLPTARVRAYGPEHGYHGGTILAAAFRRCSGSRCWRSYRGRTAQFPQG